MKRRLLTLLFAAALVGGFHEWTPPAHAAKRHHIQLPAAPQCFTAPPEDNFETAQATDNGGTDFVMSISRDARYWCSQRWRTEAQPLYKTPAESTWHVGFTAKLYAPTQTTTYPSGVDKLFDIVTESPTGTFTGYWDNGDGLQAARPITQFDWRVRFRFFNSQNIQIATLYSPTYQP